MNQCFFVDSDTGENLLIIVERSEAEAAKWGTVGSRVPEPVVRLLDINLDRSGAYVVDKIETMQILTP